MSIEQQAKDLDKLKLGALRAKYREVFGVETKSNNRPYLIKKLLQATQPRSDERAGAEERSRLGVGRGRETSGYGRCARPAQ